MATKANPERRPSGLAVALAFLVAVGAAIALIALGVLVRTSGDETSATPTAVVDFDGIPQEGAVLGSPDARVRLIEYADLQCPACRAYAETYLPVVVDEYIRQGRMKAEFRGIAFIGQESERALRWVLAAGLQDRLWQLQEALYRNQGGENAGWVTEDLLRRLAADIPGLDADRVLADASSEEVTAMLAKTERQADAADVSGTPTLAIQVGGQDPRTLSLGVSLQELRAALDDALR
jgi:protein-disulfide isomerase